MLLLYAIKSISFLITHHYLPQTPIRSCSYKSSEVLHHVRRYCQVAFSFSEEKGNFKRTLRVSIFPKAGITMEFPNADCSCEGESTLHAACCTTDSTSLPPSHIVRALSGMLEHKVRVEFTLSFSHPILSFEYLYNRRLSTSKPCLLQRGVSLSSHSFNVPGRRD